MQIVSPLKNMSDPDLSVRLCKRCPSKLKNSQQHTENNNSEDELDVVHDEPRDPVHPLRETHHAHVFLETYIFGKTLSDRVWLCN